MKEKTCCFTGHRDLPPGQTAAIAARLERCVRELVAGGVCCFGAGGALGFDTLAAQTVLKVREDCLAVKLILVLPCRTQTNGWRDSDKAVYADILRQADKVVYTSEEYTKGCMHKRNRRLVDDSSVCVCYLTRNTGGTAYTARYAAQKGLRILNLADR